ncbi:hypothetical protein ACWDBW_11430 [Streptomyces sp. NPDC001107]
MTPSPANPRRALPATGHQAAQPRTRRSKTTGTNLGTSVEHPSTTATPTDTRRTA